MTLEEIQKAEAAFPTTRSKEEKPRTDNEMKVIRRIGAKEHGRRFPCVNCGVECKVKDDVFQCERHGSFALEIVEHNGGRNHRVRLLHNYRDYL